MRLRKFDESADYRFGQGASQFWKDQPDGVAQKVGQRLQLWRGQWYLDSGEGMPWQTRVLGNRTADTRDPSIRAHVLATTGVKKITAYSSNLDRDSRAFGVGLTIDTIYGPATVTGVNF